MARLGSVFGSVLLGLLGSLSLVACTGAPDDEAGEVVPRELDGACPLDQRVGLFSVVHETDYSAIDGEINEAVIPTSIVEEVLAEGGCRLLEPSNPFCDPPCAGGDVCGQAGSCIPYPDRLETGVVTIAGLDVDVAMNPRADLRYFETALPHPVFSPGRAIALTSTGGEISPLDLGGRGFAPLELLGTTWTAQPGQPLIVEWVAEQADEANPSMTSFYMTINVDQHGTSPATLVCEGPDTGSFAVPAAIVDALLDAGVSGFPVGHAYRRTVDSASVEVGCVEFQVRSHRSAQIEVVGHTPCTSSADCPDGLSCDVVNQTCV
ncbi:hypothetical protein ACNOYE_13450 [Nannocystaceae bacterium ST9]